MAKCNCWPQMQWDYHERTINYQWPNILRNWEHGIEYIVRIDSQTFTKFQFCSQNRTKKKKKYPNSQRKKKIRNKASNFQDYFFSMSCINGGNLKEFKMTCHPLDDLPWNDPYNLKWSYSDGYLSYLDTRLTLTVLLFWIYLFLLAQVFVLQWLSLHWKILIMLLTQNYLLKTFL